MRLDRYWNSTASIPMAIIECVHIQPRWDEICKCYHIPISRVVYCHHSILHKCVGDAFIVVNKLTMIIPTETENNVKHQIMHAGQNLSDTR